MIEESRTNKQPHSEQYSPDAGDGFVNFPSGMTVDYDPGVVTPTGETTGAITFIESGGSGQHYLALDHFGAVTSGQTYTFSFFIKNISGSDTDNVKIITTTAAFPYVVRTFYFSGTNAGTTNYAADSSMIKFPNGWWKCMITLTTNNNFATTAFSMDFRGYGSGAAYDNKIALWGLTTELGTFATSYIRTGNANSGATQTRGADIVDIDGEDFTDFYNQTEGTIISSHTLLPGVPNAENVYVYQIQDASTNNVIRVVDKNSSYSNVATGLVLNGGSSQFHFNNTTDSYTKDKVLVALSVKNNDFAGCHNGGTVETDTSGTLPTNMNSLGIGRYPPTNGYELNGHIQRFIYYPKQLSDSQLKTMTS